jgi:low affinity Fe/Cu permease
MEKIKLSKYFIVLIILTIITIAIIIIQNSYNNLVGLNLLQQSQKVDLTKAIDPKLDTTIIEKLGEKNEYKY